jgi:pimeloyl-ACP methyl ester carboxylesterase
MKHRDVVILHGWNLSGERFAPLAVALRQQGYRVFAPDFPGFGTAPPPDKPWHVVDYAEFLKDYLAAERIHEPFLIGHSFGGRVALKFAHLYPEDVHAIVLTGTPGFSPVPTKKLIVFMVLSKVGGMLFALPVLNLVADRARRFLYYIAGAREFLRAEGVMRQTFKNIVRDELTNVMSRASVPCLLVWGEFDTIVPLPIARRMQEAIPNAILKVIPEADHGVPFKDPALFLSYIKDFLST